MPNHTTPKTERIRELLIAGLQPREVADKVETSREYVYKEKGKLKKKGLLVTSQSLSIADGSNSITIVKDHPTLEKFSNLDRSVRTNQLNGASDFDIPPLGKEDVMSMYASFEEKMSPSTVTAKLGIRPDISQNEYQRFLSMNSRDPFDLQNRIVSGLFSASPEIQSIIDKSVAGNLLTNDELISVINFKTAIYASQHIKNAVSDPTLSINYGLERFICKYCHFPQPGVIFDRTTYAGSILPPFSKGHCCKNCLGLKEQAFDDYQRASGKL
ncbi:MAG TPA: hypothetical protein VF884_12310 [Nitrososphaeraceae archaeon]